LQYSYFIHMPPTLIYLRHWQHY